MILRRLYRTKLSKLKSYLLISIFVCVIIKYLRCRAIEYVPQHLHKYLRFDEKYVCSSSLGSRELYDKLEKLNNKREVQNWAAFGPVQRDTPVLVVRAARDPARLQYLIVSLAQVRDIQSALVVFSHSFYDERVDRLIESITFCMVVQIYFPNSVQLSPNAFPGVDPDDCVIATADQGRFCVERVARLAERKHHWWWTAHEVFEEMGWSRMHTGMVVFLEEDSYVLGDFLHMLRYAAAALPLVPEAQLLAFGRPLAHRLDRDKLTFDSWRPPYDRGMAFNKTTWRKIKALSDRFCAYDDVSWSYSLLHAFSKTPQGRVIMVACMAPRVISTGVYKNGRNALEHIHRLSSSEDLFPSKVHGVMLFGRDGRIFRRWRAPPRGNGGWSDLRDQLLCAEPLVATVTDDDSTTTPPIFTITSKKNPVTRAKLFSSSTRPPTAEPT